jgi:hypothetical protein
MPNSSEARSDNVASRGKLMVMIRGVKGDPAGQTIRPGAGGFLIL